MDNRERTLDGVFAELDSRLEQLVQLAQLVDEKLAGQVSSPASKSISSPSCQVPSAARS